MQKLICIVGPTGIGKSDVAIRLAKLVQGEIISADSMQIYKHCTIGTAKVTTEEMEGVAHWGIDIVEPSEPFTVNDWVAFATRAIQDILSRGKTPIVVGGTGLYVEALLYGFSFAGVGQDEAYRKTLETIRQEQGNEYLHELLESIDAQFASHIHPNQYKRVMRALEVYHISGALPKKQEDKQAQYDALIIGLEENRENVYKRINERVEKMLTQGLVEEVNSLLTTYKVPTTAQSMQAIGYREVVAYIEGQLGYEAMVEKLKQNSRHYAKRQFTWFKRMKDVCWFTRTDEKAIQEKVKEFLCKTQKK